MLQDFFQLLFGHAMPIFRVNKLLRIVRVLAAMADLESKPGINVRHPSHLQM